MLWKEFEGDGKKIGYRYYGLRSVVLGKDFQIYVYNLIQNDTKTSTKGGNGVMRQLHIEP